MQVTLYSLCSEMGSQCSSCWWQGAKRMSPAAKFWIFWRGWMTELGGVPMRRQHLMHQTGAWHTQTHIWCTNKGPDVHKRVSDALNRGLAHTNIYLIHETGAWCTQTCIWCTKQGPGTHKCVFDALTGAWCTQTCIWCTKQGPDAHKHVSDALNRGLMHTNMHLMH